MLEAVSFDIWGTLLSLDVFFVKISEELSELTGEDAKEIERKLYDSYLRAKEIRRRGGFSEGRMVLEALSAVSEMTGFEIEELKRAISRAIISYEGGEGKIEGVDEVLEYCSSKGLKMVTLGNVLFWPGWYTRILLEKAGISKRIMCQIYADEIWHSKPKKEAFEAAMMAAGVKDPRRMIHVGDSDLEDGEGAIAFGMNAAVIGGEFKVERRGEIFLYRIPKIEKLPEVIESLLS